MNYAFGYCRVSTRDQRDNGLSLSNQRMAIEAFCTKELTTHQFAGIFQDAAVSGKIPFFDRPQGSKLARQVRRGDVIVSTRLDRMFRTLRDMCNCLELWKNTGVRVRLLDINLDTSTAVGELAVSMMGAIAQFEHRLITERLREGYDRMSPEARARMLAGLRPQRIRYGFKCPDLNNRKVLVPWPEEQSILVLIHDLRVNGKMRYDHIATWLRNRGIREPRFPDRDFSEATVQDMFKSYMRFLKRDESERSSCQYIVQAAGAV